MSYTVPMSDEDKKWQAESDARNIAESAAIKADQHRYAAAQEAAKRMAEEEEAKAKALKELGEGDWPLDYKGT